MEEVPSGEHDGPRQELSLGPTARLDNWIQSHWVQAPGDCGDRCVGVGDMSNPEAHSSHSWLRYWALGESQPFITGDGGLTALDLEMGPRLQGSCEDTGLPRDIPSVGVSGAG